MPSGPQDCAIGSHEVDVGACGVLRGVGNPNPIGGPCRLSAATAGRAVGQAPDRSLDGQHSMGDVHHVNVESAAAIGLECDPESVRRPIRHPSWASVVVSGVCSLPSAFITKRSSLLVRFEEKAMTPSPLPPSGGGDVVAGLGKSVGVGRGAVEVARPDGTVGNSSVGAERSPAQPATRSTTTAPRISAKRWCKVPSFSRRPSTPCGQSLAHRPPGRA